MNIIKKKIGSKNHPAVFRFNLNQFVWYIYDNEVHTSLIVGRLYEDNVPESLGFKIYGKSRVRYETQHGTFNENELFISKRELIKHL